MIWTESNLFNYNKSILFFALPKLQFKLSIFSDIQFIFVLFLCYGFEHHVASYNGSKKLKNTNLFRSIRILDKRNAKMYFLLCLLCKMFPNSIWGYRTHDSRLAYAYYQSSEWNFFLHRWGVVANCFQIIDQPCLHSNRLSFYQSSNTKMDQ